MAKIEVDDPVIRKNITRINELVKEVGGWVNPNLILHEQDGGLSVRYNGEQDPSETLIVLPEEALLPISAMEITSKDNKLQVQVNKDFDIGPEREELVDLIFDLYNYTNKLEYTHDTDFWLTMSQDHDIFDVITQARSRRQPALDFFEKLKEGFNETELEEHIRTRFISARVLGYSRNIKGVSEKTGNDKPNAKESIIMPIIDFFNHHPRGSRFISPKEKKGLEVRNVQPVEGSHECYAFYGVMDPLDAYIRYGFIDACSTIIRSVPVDIDIPDIGIMRINSNAPSFKKKPVLGKKVKDLANYIPSVRFDERGDLVVSHMYIPIGQSPHALRRVIGICLRHFTKGTFRSQEEMLEKLRDIEMRIRDANLTFYKNLQKLARDKKEQGENTPAVHNALALADWMVEGVSNYELYDEFMARQE